MERYLEGDHTAGKGLRIGIAVSRFNEVITTRLLEGALEELRNHGVEIDIAKVPGAFELPITVKAMAQSGRYDAVIALGAIIRGETPHYDYLAREVTRGVGEAALTSMVPVTYGILTTETVAQAVERSGTAPSNKGWEAAMAALEMAHLLKQLEKPR